jgi:hypothetical protein
MKNKQSGADLPITQALYLVNDSQLPGKSPGLPDVYREERLDEEQLSAINLLKIKTEELRVLLNQQDN